MSDRDLVLIGGGGFAEEVLEVANSLGYSIVGYFDDKKTKLKLNFLGSLEDYFHEIDYYHLVFVAIGSTNKATIKVRQKVIDIMRLRSVDSPCLVSPHATIAQGVSIGFGSFIAHGVVLSVGCQVGNFCIVNTSAVVGHHSIIKYNVTIGPMVFVGGKVQINDYVILGAAAKVLQGLSIGSHCIIGIGSTVLRDLDDNTTVWPLLNKHTVD